LAVARTDADGDIVGGVGDMLSDRFMLADDHSLAWCSAPIEASYDRHPTKSRARRAADPVRVPPDGRPPPQNVSAFGPDGRVPILYLAPWVGYGGTDSGTIDWFRSLDRERFAPYLVTTQPSSNDRLAEVYPYAEEVWALPEFLGGQHMPSFVFDLIHTRGIRLVHLMNSRIGFELIADMAALPHPPGVVVQLHVEEHDRSGYVRLVTTRYGNLVDGFSVVSDDLARAVEGYGIPPERIAVIPLGVDARERFDPERVRPIEELVDGRFHILHTGRLTAQKDPLLAVEVIRRVVETHPHALLHVVGEGELEGELREYARAGGLGDHVTFHPMTRELDRWYAGCDMVLMTSLFEGVPCVVYETMAMRVPVVAPALPGNRELMGDTGGMLIEPRDDASAYAAAVCRLIDDSSERERLGREGRERVLRDFTVEGMAEAHARLYERVLHTSEERARRSACAIPNGARRESVLPTISPGLPPRGPFWASPGSAEQLRFVERPIGVQAPVSAIVPCFNHGRYLPECIDSILEQDYPELEVIVVDDASTEESTLGVLAELETRERVSILRQPRNSGPSAARNRGVAAAHGRYILPVDADNLLMSGAISGMVEQLQAAGEQIGFIYPNCQYFGTRDDYFQPPSYNVYLLMEGNYCDTCSLIDRTVFDAGIRYPEDIVFGHEDWDFALTLAARGVRGQPARQPTLRYRKHGFTRSDAVEYARNSFRQGIPERHPDLFGSGDPAARHGRYWSPAVDIKAHWAPALSIVLSAPVDLAEKHGRRLIEGLEHQTCRDFEVVLECPMLPVQAPQTPLRRIPPGLCASTGARLRDGLKMARGRYLLVASVELASILQERGFVERLFRTMLARPILEAIAFTDAGRLGHIPYRLLASDQVTNPAHALFWELSAQRKLPEALRLEEGKEIESLARAMSLHEVELQWRHVPVLGGTDPASRSSRSMALDPAGDWLDLAGSVGDTDPHRTYELAKIHEADPAIPALPWNEIKRWLGFQSWIPPETDLLTRHRKLGSERRIVRRGEKPVPGYELEFHLGAIQRFAPPGTVRLAKDTDGTLHTVPRGSPRDNAVEELGHLEQAALPLLNAIELAVLPNGSTTLVCTDRDPLRATAVQLELLGYIESYPNEPVWPPDARLPRRGRVGLMRCLDQDRRRHFYRVGKNTDGAVVGELGALHLTAEASSIPIWVDQAGRVSTDRYHPVAVSPDTRQLARWVGAPVGWRRFGRPTGRARAMLRRGAQAAAIGIASRRRNGTVAENGAEAKQANSGANRALVGHLYREGGPRRRELFAAIHPITGDQLLTPHRLEADDMGYGSVVSLGYALTDLPFTGSLSMRRVAVPWASRFGLEVRRA
jgi:glycosyltransferase involved in cell wall biosynthesis